MRSVEMPVAFEPRALAHWHAAPARERREESPGRRVPVRDRGGEPRDIPACGPCHQDVEHPRGDPRAPCPGRHGHLPDEKLVRRGRCAIGRDPSRKRPAPLRHHACLGEMRALQEVAVPGIGIERRAFLDQAKDCGRILRAGNADAQNSLIRVSDACGSRWSAQWNRSPSNVVLWPIYFDFRIIWPGSAVS